MGFSIYPKSPYLAAWLLLKNIIPQSLKLTDQLEVEY